MMKIYDFTMPELEYFRALCNFSELEMEYFNLRARHKSNTEIAFAMHVSEAQVSKIARKVKDKMVRVL